MAQTRRRPIPASGIAPAKALAFGIALSLASVIAMAMVANRTAALLLALAISFYLFVYTIWLKRRTPQNIVIGGAADALLPVIGWAAVTGQVDVEPVALFLNIFLLTPPHLWALALCRAEHNATAGTPKIGRGSGREKGGE